MAQHDNRNCILPFLSLNEIEKCSELTQQQKSERAGRLIKSNPNVGRLLLRPLASSHPRHSLIYDRADIPRAAAPLPRRRALKGA